LGYVNLLPPVKSIFGCGTEFLDRQGMFILWDVDPEATAQVSDLPDYHLANPITAMAYIDSRQWLLTASRRHLQITDMRNPKYKGGVGSTRTVRDSFTKF